MKKKKKKLKYTFNWKNFIIGQGGIGIILILIDCFTTNFKFTNSIMNNLGLHFILLIGVVTLITGALKSVDFK